MNVAKFVTTHAGFFAGVGAFVTWGSLPLYWQELQTIPAVEILAHRIFWSFIVLAPLMLVKKYKIQITSAFADKWLLFRIATSATLIAFNWGLYVWAITHGYVIECSLGYFINPLLNVFLGFALLRERLTHLQTLAIIIAACGVGWDIVYLGQIPWVALALALSFALYGFCRKTVSISAMGGQMVESILLFPFALGWLVFLEMRGEGSFFTVPLLQQVLLFGTGIVTCVPLALFAFAARNMSLGSLGLLQYLSPTATFLLGVYVFKEPLTSASLITFVCIWIALALYSWCTIRQLRSIPHK